MSPAHLVGRGLAKAVEWLAHPRCELADCRSHLSEECLRPDQIVLSRHYILIFAHDIEAYDPEAERPGVGPR